MLEPSWPGPKPAPLFCIPPPSPHLDSGLGISVQYGQLVATELGSKCQGPAASSVQPILTLLPRAEVLSPQESIPRASWGQGAAETVSSKTAKDRELGLSGKEASKRGELGPRVTFQGDWLGTQRALFVKTGSGLRQEPLPVYIQTALDEALNGTYPGFSIFSSQKRPLDSIPSEPAPKKGHLTARLKIRSLALAIARFTGRVGGPA